MAPAVGQYDEATDECAQIAFSDTMELNHLLFPKYFMKEIREGAVRIQKLGSCSDLVVEPTPSPISSVDRTAELNIWIWDEKIQWRWLESGD